MSQEQIQNCIVGDIPINYKPPTWDQWFMRLVYLVASKSKDNSTKIGAVITKNNRIISVGYNGFPAGVDDNVSNRYERPQKYMWFEHAERNSLFAAGRYGTATDGCILYTQGMPCSDCGRAVIQSGIKEVVIHSPFDKILLTLRDHWNESCATSEIMFKEAGVKVRYLDELIGVEGFSSGKIINV